MINKSAHTDLLHKANQKLSKEVQLLKSSLAYQTAENVKLKALVIDMSKTLASFSSLLANSQIEEKHDADSISSGSQERVPRSL